MLKVIQSTALAVLFVLLFSFKYICVRYFACKFGKSASKKLCPLRTY